MSKINVVLFSSGNSERLGILDAVRTNLELNGFNCSCWRDLFSDANDSSNIALLPMLIKKIPSFDYAILICEGDDETTIHRGDESEVVHSMRDNVLFEIGLCTMALGLSKVILFSEEDLRLPEDLIGIHGELAIKRIIYDSKEVGSVVKSINLLSEYMHKTNGPLSELITYIKDTSMELSPMIVGAAISTAVGYVRNFIFQMCKNERVLFTTKGDNAKDYIFSLEKFKVHIVLPHVINEDTLSKIAKKKKELSRGFIHEENARDVNVDFKMQDDVLHIYDYPTTISASYDTVQLILDIQADDVLDTKAKERFMAKELKLYCMAIDKLLHSDFVDHSFDYIKDESVRAKMIENLKYAIENCIEISWLD